VIPYKCISHKKSFEKIAAAFFNMSRSMRRRLFSRRSSLNSSSSDLSHILASTYPNSIPDFQITGHLTDTTALINNQPNCFQSYGDFWCMRNEEKAAHPLL
jgi:hypothetical protein